MASGSRQMHRTDDGRIRVWDPLVRGCHWILAAAFFVAYFTEDDLLTLHVWAGYAAGTVVVLRVLWGFAGPRYARFSEFVYGPSVAWRYLLDLFAFRARRYLGHSPAGGVMVLALLAGILVTVWSGLELHAIENHAGPLAQVSGADMTGSALLSRMDVIADEGEKDEDDETKSGRSRGAEGGNGELWEAIHESLADIMLVLVILHIAGVLLASIVHHENLSRSMVTGYKRAGSDED